MSRLPLEDVVVVGLEQAVAAPYATRLLADLGARVIKVEHPEGGDFARTYDDVVGGLSSVFVWLNRGKESVQLDLKSAASREALEDLLGAADVVVANLSPRALAALGLGVEALGERHPGLIVCTISGYAPDGPQPERKAYDALIQAESGLMALTGWPDSPAKAGISVADIAAGSFAHSGILAALRHRDRTGEVLPVHVPLFGALTEWMAYPLYYTAHGGAAPEPMGTAHPTIAPYGAMPTADGGRLMIAVQNDREWRRLCSDVLRTPALLENPRLASNGLRVAHRAELDELVDAVFRTLPEAVLVERLEAADIAWARLNQVTDLAQHPELAVPARWLDTPTPNGPVRTLTPIATPGARVARDGAVPGLGQQTDTVLAEIAARRKETA
ncbi:CoA transferase [Pseudonocardia kujensis]|uniref:CaiB/BaiF CoA transferase family protein n=1 Tax=Pseudonocardia kujensis TaxID=1128675 RepID=UPI001E470859|nr:CaiB/BaiF CoA-transferase family protein [Pseudonocardia kujensis]MCE0763223.1 CoA transferase [Pseudonocardia kujensis]